MIALDPNPPRPPPKFDFYGRRVRPPRLASREAAVYVEVDEQTSVLQQAIVRWLDEKP